MAAGTELRPPTTPADIETAADQFMKIADSKRDMLKAAFAVFGLHQEKVVVIAGFGTTQEDAASGKAIRHVEAELFRIKLFHFLTIGREKNDVRQLYGLGFFIDGSWGIDALNSTPRVHGYPHDVELALARDAKARRKPHRILAADLAIVHEKARSKIGRAHV